MPPKAAPRVGSTSSAGAAADASATGGGAASTSSTRRSKGRRAGLVQMASYARIKPIVDDTRGVGTAASKRIAGWDEEGGTVAIAGAMVGRKSSTDADGNLQFTHLSRTLPPDATQAHVYDVIAAPLVGKFLDGFDVDLISYGQTGSGKTFTMFGPPHAMAKASTAVKRGAAADGILADEHGFCLRAGFDSVAAVNAMNAGGKRAVLYGSMIEVSIMSFADQTVCDLLNDLKPCYVDDAHHLQGARQIELTTNEDVVHMAAAVENRLTRGTRMNDTSSRSHCVTVLTLLVLEGDSVRESRLQFFDLMGSERFVGQNAAHDPSKSSKSTASGWEGIYSNFSLMALMSVVDEAASARARGTPVVQGKMISFLLTKLLMGSLVGDALTAMITCLSQAPRDGEETYLSLKYGAGMAKLMNKPKPQPLRNVAGLLDNARRQHTHSAAQVARGVQGKYAARRAAEVAQWRHVIAVLETFAPGVAADGGGAAASAGGGSSGTDSGSRAGALASGTGAGAGAGTRATAGAGDDGGGGADWGGGDEKK